MSRRSRMKRPDELTQGRQQIKGYQCTEFDVYSTPENELVISMSFSGLKLIDILDIDELTSLIASLTRIKQRYDYAIAALKDE